MSNRDLLARKIVMSRMDARTVIDIVIAEVAAAVREGSVGSWHGDYWADYIERVFGAER